MRVLTLGLIVLAPALAAETGTDAAAAAQTQRRTLRRKQHLLGTCGAREGCSCSACTDDPELGTEITLEAAMAIQLQNPRRLG